MFKQPKKDLDNITASDIQEYKLFFDITDNQKTNRIIIKNIINSEADDLEGDKQLFQSRLRKKN